MTVENCIPTVESCITTVEECSIVVLERINKEKKIKYSNTCYVYEGLWIRRRIFILSEYELSE